ncbi:hypothetical protein HK101_005038 [Irineochytrium annulatum]|nr:hypothetical protein HK101_005038 [Irineochytrium annulatum]
MALRKLQTEIDKTLKKVAEGVEIFEGIFDKIQTAGNAAQKEKFENDLKKEIKKLQRYRDQIKTWISSNDIKDKRALLENRKLIETQMERFKACEKELKTKAFSKEGLLQPSKIDPAERHKAELSEWVSDTKDKLSTQIDALEAEAEQMQSAAKKGRGKDNSKADRLAAIEKQVERHNHHISRLEVIQRMLDNGNITVDAVNEIKDNVNYYVDSNQDPEFDEDEGIYDDLNLDDAEFMGLPGDEEKDSNASDGTGYTVQGTNLIRIADDDLDSELRMSETTRKSKEPDETPATSPSKFTAKATPTPSKSKDDRNIFASFDLRLHS